MRRFERRANEVVFVGIDVSKSWARELKVARRKDPGMSYDPPGKPDVALPLSLRPLRETLAARVHDCWARARLDAGWTWGPERDDGKKTHPGLVPYTDLPDSEKELDRLTAETTIATILELGYQLVDKT